MLQILNIVIVIAVLAGMNATLTLPGIAGLILTIGMAVDANVIIFERVKEEFGLYRGGLQYKPPPEEIGLAMEIGPEKVEEILKISQEPVSLETPIGEEEDSHQGMPLM